MTEAKFIDLFSGCGGFSLGLAQAGLKGVFAIERDPMAFRTFEENFLLPTARLGRFPASNSKSKKIRSVPLNDSALDVLQQLDTEGAFEHLFVNRRTEKPYGTIMKVWSRLRSKADDEEEHGHHHLAHQRGQQ